MPRNSSGTYTLPQPPFVPNTTILSGPVNSDFSDIATALTQSMATSGVSAMTGALLLAAGTPAAPSLAFGTDPTTGLYTAGSHQLNLAANGVLVITVTSNGLQLNLGTLIDNAGNRLGTVPLGSIIDYGGATAPAFWLLCFGQAVSRSTYSGLFAAIGTTWGIGDGSTTFNVPDLRGRTEYGKDNMGGTAAGRISAAGGNYDGTVLGTTGGSQNHTLTVAELAPHGHGITDPGHVHTINASSLGATAGPSSNYYNSGVAGFTTASATTGITINNAGSGNAHTVLNPSAIVNKIIFAGV